jgi:hypothetical protein
VTQSYGWFFLDFESIDTSVGSIIPSSSLVRDELLKQLSNISSSDADIFMMGMKLICQIIMQALLSLQSFDLQSFKNALKQNLNNLYSSFPHPQSNSHVFQGVLPELCQEIHDMFFVSLQHEIFPPAQMLSYKINVKSPHVVLMYRQGLDLVLRNNAVWQRILWLIDAYRLPCIISQNSGNDKLQLAATLPLLSTYEERCHCLETKFTAQEIFQAIYFLEPSSSQLSTRMWEEFYQYPTGDTSAGEESVKIDNERKMARIAQCASLVIDQTSGGIAMKQSSNGVCNPFDQEQLVVLILSSTVVPTTFHQSCVPNVFVDVKYNDLQKCLQLKFIANQDIYEGDLFSFQFASPHDDVHDSQLLAFGPCGRLYHNTEDSISTQNCNGADSNPALAFISCSCIVCNYASVSQASRSKKTYFSTSKVLPALIQKISICNTEEQEVSTLMGDELQAKRRRLDNDGGIMFPISTLSNGDLQVLSLKDLHEWIQELQEKGTRTNSSFTTEGTTISFKIMRQLRLLADNFMLKNKVSDAIDLYVFLLQQALHTEILFNNIETQNNGNHSVIMEFFAEICLSVGIAGFDLLLDHSNQSALVDQWSIEIIVALYHLGLRWNSRNIQLQELVEKATSYESLWRTDLQSRLEIGFWKESRSFDIILDVDDKSSTKSLQPRDPSGRVCISKLPILSPTECKYVIDIAEEYAGCGGRGWTTSRHYTVPTTDIPLHKMPQLCKWFTEEILEQRLLPFLQSAFFPSLNEKPAIQIYVNDIFVVKYSDTQRYLPLHTDQSSHSLTIALNDIDDYVGGGTYFSTIKQSIRPKQGHVVSFHGHLMHSGDPIVNGTRYIIAAFFAILPRKPDRSNVVNISNNYNRLANCFLKQESSITPPGEVVHDEDGKEKSISEFSFEFF